MRLILRLPMVCAILCATTLGQFALQEGQRNSLVPIRDLPVPSSLRPTDLNAVGIYGNIECDDHLTIYFRSLLPNSDPSAQPITKLKTDGSSKTVDLSRVPGLEQQLQTISFAVDRTGTIFTVGHRDTEPPNRFYLLSYGSDGAFQWKSPIVFEAMPSILLPLGNDLFLIAGATRHMGKAQENQSSSIAALFNRDGGLVKFLGPTSRDASLPRSGEGLQDPGIQLGTAKVGPDGFAYFFRGGPTPKVQVLNSVGKTVRILALQPPVQNAQAYDFFVGRSTVVAAFQQTLHNADDKKESRTLYSVYNVNSGEPISTYVQRSHGILACVQDDTFTFIGTTIDQRFAIGQATFP